MSRATQLVSGRACPIPELVESDTLLRYSFFKGPRQANVRWVWWADCQPQGRKSVGGAEAGSQVSQPPHQGSFHQSRLFFLGSGSKADPGAGGLEWGVYDPSTVSHSPCSTHVPGGPRLTSHSLGLLPGTVGRQVPPALPFPACRLRSLQDPWMNLPGCLAVPIP